MSFDVLKHKSFLTPPAYPPQRCPSMNSVEEENVPPQNYNTDDFQLQIIKTQGTQKEPLAPALAV